MKGGDPQKGWKSGSEGAPPEEPGQWFSREGTLKWARTAALSGKGTPRGLGTAGVLGDPERGWNSDCDGGPRGGWGPGSERGPGGRAVEARPRPAWVRRGGLGSGRGAG